MQNTQATYIGKISFLVIGLVIGWFIWGHNKQPIPQGHMMPDGTMMNGDGSDMSSMMANMNDSLKGKTGDDFDKEFLAEMIVHHQGAIDMADLSATNAKHQELKDLSAGIISAQVKEIEQMKAWQKAWYNQ
ncbi:MAG: uncharacterized protein JWL92_275 [Candidatus Nomurabacteria bacterium]|nr:uncharacterized protein [Candidatus Nomurabacteria bacterium]